MIKLNGVKDVNLCSHVFCICLPSHSPDVMVPEWTLPKVHMSDMSENGNNATCFPFVADGRDSLQLRLRV